MRTLRSIADFAKETAFTEAQLRWFIFNESNNGMKQAGAVIRIGRRVYIDVEGFDRWLNQMNPEATNG